MNSKIIYIISLLLTITFGAHAQTTLPTPEVYFQEDDTIDIYADESATITNKINYNEQEDVKWSIVFYGKNFYYTTGSYEDGSFTFTPPNPSENTVKTYDFPVNIKKILKDESECLLDTTKTFYIRVYPKPRATVVARFCTNYEDETGFTAIPISNKSSLTDGVFHLSSYATHVLRISVPSVSKDESCWEWSIGDSIRKAGIGQTCKFRFSEEDASEDGTSHFYKIKLRNKLPYRKETFEDEYNLECKVYPVPTAGVCEYVETYSGKAAGFGLQYSGGIKDAWRVNWSDGNGNEYTEEEMNNICKYVDEPTKFIYRLYVNNGDDFTGYYHGITHPVLMVWKEPKASVYNVNGTVITDWNNKDEHNIACSEEDEISVSFKVDGGYETDDSWISFVDSSSTSSMNDSVVTCKFKIVIPDSIRSKAKSETCTYPIYVKIQNRYTGTNSSPDSIWFNDSIKVNLNVLLHPLAPTKLIRKGNGNSGTVIASVNNNDPYTSMSNYSLVYGYENANGDVIEHQKKFIDVINRKHLYDTFPKAELADKTNKFYVYATIHIRGTELTSDRCYLTNDEELQEDVTEVRKYEVNGRQINSTTRGLVIIQMSDGSTKKVIQK